MGGLEHGRAASTPSPIPWTSAGHVTHGHLAEDNNHGGAWAVGTAAAAYPPTARAARSRSRSSSTTLATSRRRRLQRCIPTVTQGHSLTFVNDDASPLSPGNPLSPTRAYLDSVFHTVTSCQDPCGLNTGISYPLANGTGGL